MSIVRKELYNMLHSINWVMCEELYTTKAQVKVVPLHCTVQYPILWIFENASVAIGVFNQGNLFFYIV